MRLQNKTALITGGNSGIGLATAQAVRRRRRAGRYHRAQSGDAGRRRQGTRPQRVGVVADATDVAATRSRDQERRRKIRQARHRLRQCGHRRRHADRRHQRWRPLNRCIRTNVTAVFFTVQAAVPHMNDGGSIVLNGSVISVLGNPGYAAYAASKAGVRAMARVMASELSPRGIRVNVVAPGAIRTPIWGQAIATPEAEKAFEARIGRTTPLGPYRRARARREDRAVPRFRRCRPYPGPGTVRRRRRHGFTCGSADLSRIGVGEPGRQSERVAPELVAWLHAGSIVHGRILGKPRFALNLCRRCCDILVGQGIFVPTNELEPDMSKVVRISRIDSCVQSSSEKSDNHQLISIALFSGIGLLISLVAYSLRRARRVVSDRLFLRRDTSAPHLGGWCLLSSQAACSIS